MGGYQHLRLVVGVEPVRDLREQRCVAVVRQGGEVDLRGPEIDRVGHRRSTGDVPQFGAGQRRRREQAHGIEPEARGEVARGSHVLLGLPWKADHEEAGAADVVAAHHLHGGANGVKIDLFVDPPQRLGAPRLDTQEDLLAARLPHPLDQLGVDTIGAGLAVERHDQLAFDHRVADLEVRDRRIVKTLS